MDWARFYRGVPSIFKWFNVVSVLSIIYCIGMVCVRGTFLTSFAFVFSLQACSSFPENSGLADKAASVGDFELASAELAKEYKGRGSDDKYLADLVRLTSKSLESLVRQAELAKKKGDFTQAESIYRRALSIDGNFSRALTGIAVIEQDRRQARLITTAQQALAQGDLRSASDDVKQILSENPLHVEALGVRKKIRELNYTQEHKPLFLSSALKNTISLELRDIPIKDALALISNSAKFNFILDQDIPADKKVTLFVTDAKIEDVLEFLMQTFGLEKKVLNKNTVLIYLASSEKKAQYADLYTRSFHIANSSAGAVADLLRGILKPSDIYVDEYARSVVIRDTVDVLEAAERLIALHDVAPPEVILDVEIVEITTDLLANLGVEYPSKITMSVQGSDNKVGSLRWSELKDLNSDSFVLGVGDPLAVLNLKNTLGSGNILAKPQIRVKNREKANILIGDKVPVITSTLNQTSGFESQSVTYLDVGIKLDVQPEIFPGNEVSMKVMLEVSNIAKEIIGESGLRAYQIGTRTANTTLQLKDGETQILAGLIKNEEINSESRVPGLGAIPGLGRLFSNENSSHKKSELVLLITPRIVRNTNFPDSFESEFYSGTKERFSLAVPELGENANYASAAKASVLQDDGAAVETRSLASSMPAPVVRVKSQKSSLPQPSAQFSLIAPNSITAGQEFNVPIALDSQYSKAVNFSLASKGVYLEIVSITSMVPSADLTQSSEPALANFSLAGSRGLRGSDVLAIARVRALPVNSPQMAVLELKPVPSSDGLAPTVLGTLQTIQVLPAGPAGVTPGGAIPGAVIP